MFTSGTRILYNVFSVVNKVKQISIAMIIDDHQRGGVRQSAR